MEATELLDFLEINWEVFAALSLLTTFITNYIKRRIPDIKGKWCILVSLGVAALLSLVYCAKTSAWSAFPGLTALFWFGSMVAWDNVKMLAHKVGPSQ